MARPKRLQGRATKNKKGDTVTLALDAETKVILNHMKKHVNFSEWFRERVKFEYSQYTTKDQQIEILRQRYVSLQDTLERRMQLLKDEFEPQIQKVARQLSKEIHDTEIQLEEEIDIESI